MTARSFQCLILAAFILCCAFASSTRTILAIQAANAPVNWTEVALTSQSNHSWVIEELELAGFGADMSTHGFQTALEKAEAQLVAALRYFDPDMLLLSSKGVGVLTFLSIKGLWNGPAVLLSPIPNACDHINGGSWDVEWKSTLGVLTSTGVAPMGIGVGTSVDEQSFIVEAMEQTGVCGKLKPSTLFETCPLYFLKSFDGNHRWKNNEKNYGNIALLIDVVFYLHDQLEATKHQEL